MSTASAALAGKAAVLALLVLLGGCSASRPAPAPAGSPRATVDLGPAATRGGTAPCASYGCTAGKFQQLTGGFAVRLWLSKQPSTTDSPELRSTPVIELLKDGRHISWWTGRLGFGWTAQLSCLPTPAQPNCIVVAELGAHAGSAEVVLLQGGGLVSPATASVQFDSGKPVAADLDHDGRLDVVGIENDYRPNFATGHNFWASYRLVGQALQRTGCLPVTASSGAPTRLLTGSCPVVAQG